MRVLWWYLAGLMFAALAARGQVVCFRSAGEAAAQGGVRDELGFRLEGVSRDVFGGRRWAEVRSCRYPERPSVLVALKDGRSGAEARLGRDEAVTKVGHAEGLARQIVMKAGARVTVVSADTMVRMEMSGVAVESAAAGERVRVRLASSGEAGERIAVGVARSAELVEMVR